MCWYLSIIEFENLLVSRDWTVALNETTAHEPQSRDSS